MSEDIHQDIHQDIHHQEFPKGNCVPPTPRPWLSRIDNIQLPICTSNYTIVLVSIRRRYLKETRAPGDRRWSRAGVN